MLLPRDRTAPDLPMSFGYKQKWLALSETSPQRLLEVLDLHHGRVANWTTQRTLQISGQLLQFNSDSDPSIVLRVTLPDVD